MSVIKVNIHTRFMVLFTSGAQLTWGEPLDALPGISLRYLSTVSSQLTISPFLLQTSYNDRVCFLLARSRSREERDGSKVGGIKICPSLQWFHIPSLSSAELSSLNSLKALGERQNVHHNIAFLLVLAGKEPTGDRKYGLSTIWVNPCQARVPSMEEVVGKLTAWV